MLIDANILLYAVDERSRFHRRAGEWLTGVLNGEQRVGIPWLSLVAFVRIVTHPRANDRPLTPDEAAQIVRAWIEVDVVWHPEPGPRHAELFLSTVEQLQLTGPVITDAHLAALALELDQRCCDGGGCRPSIEPRPVTSVYVGR